MLITGESDCVLNRIIKAPSTPMSLDDLYGAFKDWQEECGTLKNPQVASDYKSRVKRAISHWEKNKGASFIDELHQIAELPASEQREALCQLIRDVEMMLLAVPLVIKTSSEAGTKNSLNSILTALSAFLKFLFVLFGLPQSLPVPIGKAQAQTVCENGVEETKPVQEDESVWLETDVPMVLEAKTLRKLLEKKIKNRLGSDPRFGRLLKAEVLGNRKWLDDCWNKTQVLTRCGVHYLKDVEALAFCDNVLYVKPRIYSKHWKFSKGKNKLNSHYPAIDQYGFVEALSYDAYGYVRTFDVDENENPWKQINVDHCPALGIVLNATFHPEFDKLANGNTNVDAQKLNDEVAEILSYTSLVLMNERQNKIKNKWW